MNRFVSLAMLSIVACLNASHSYAQPPGTIQDESKVPEYTLPDPLVGEDGETVASPEEWRDSRRPEILRLFEGLMYGKTPGGRLESMRSEVVESSDEALDGLAKRKQIRIYFNGDKDGPRMDLLLYTPADAKGPVPTFLGLNFKGNHTVCPDPAILLPEGGGGIGPRIEYPMAG